MDSDSNCAIGITSTYILYLFLVEAITPSLWSAMCGGCSTAKGIKSPFLKSLAGTGLTAHKLLLLDTASQYMNIDTAQYNNPTSP